LLITLAAGKVAIVEYHERDQYGRLVGKVLVGGADVKPRAGQARARLALPRVRERADAGGPDSLRRH
jgi:hypothetical protein